MTAHRTRRGLLAFVALLAGWLAGSLAIWAFEGLLVDNPGGMPGLLWFTALVGFFAGLAWLVSVLPVALFVDHRRWFFRPAVAPFVGAGCGALLLLLETWIFFGVPPWDYAASPAFGDAYLLGIALLIGAVAWTVYTLGVRAWRRTTPPPDPPPGRAPLKWGLVLALSAALGPGPALAQDTACTWDACALRVEGGSLLQGVRGEVRGTVVGLVPDVSILMAGPDSAAAYAARFGIARPRSDQWETWGGLGRGLALAAWISFALGDAGEGWAWSAAALMPVAQSARAHARRQDVIAERALERAVWWYNRDLAAPVAFEAGSVSPALAGRMAPLPAERSLWDLAPLAGGVLGGTLTSIFTDRAGWIVTGVLWGTSIGNGFADRQLRP